MSLRAPEAVEARGTEPSDTNELRYALTEAHVGGTSLNQVAGRDSELAAPDLAGPQGEEVVAHKREQQFKIIPP